MRTLPRRFRGEFAGFSDKAVLVRAFDDLLPAEILRRRKIGYPSYYWNRGELRPLRERLLSSEGLERTGLFREDAVRKICAADDASPKKSAGKRVWGLLALQAWYEFYVNRDDEYLAEL